MAGFNDYDPLPPGATLQQRVQRLEAYVELIDRNFAEEIGRMLNHQHPQYQPRVLTTRSSSDFRPLNRDLSDDTLPTPELQRPCCDSIIGDAHKPWCYNYGD